MREPTVFRPWTCSAETRHEEGHILHGSLNEAKASLDQAKEMDNFKAETAIVEKPSMPS